MTHKVPNPTGIGGPKKGEVRNPSGLSKEQARLREETRKIIFAAGPDLAKYLIDRIKMAEGSAEQDMTSIALKALEHVIGKATDSLEISGKDGGPVQAVINFGVKPTEE